MAQMRIYAFILIYAIIVILVLVGNTVLLTVRTQLVTKIRAERTTLISLARAVDVMGNFRMLGEQNVDRLSAQIESLDMYARDIEEEAPLSDYLPSMKAYVLPQASPSQLTQEEIWLYPERAHALDVQSDSYDTEESQFRVEGCGCSRRDDTCYIYRNLTSTTVPSSSLTNRTAEDPTVKESYPFTSFWLNAAMMQSLTFTDVNTGMWSPVLRRYTKRPTTLQCEGHGFERVFAYYKCIELLDEGVKPKVVNYFPESFTLLGDRFVTNDTALYPNFNNTPRRYCKHAIVSQVVQSYVDSLQSYSLSPDSTIMQGSRYLMDTMHGKCSIPENMAREIDVIIREETDQFRTDGPVEVSRVYYRDANVSTVIVERTPNGIGLGFNEQIPNSSFFGALDRDRNISIIIVAVFSVLAALASVILWWCISVPLQRICGKMNKVTNSAEALSGVGSSSDNGVESEVLDCANYYDGSTSDNKHSGSPLGGNEMIDFAKAQPKKSRMSVKFSRMMKKVKQLLMLGGDDEPNTHLCGVAVSEVLDLQAAYEELCSALNDLRAYLPQEMDVLTHRDPALRTPDNETVPAEIGHSPHKNGHSSGPREGDETDGNEVFDFSIYSPHSPKETKGSKSQSDESKGAEKPAMQTNKSTSDSSGHTHYEMVQIVSTAHLQDSTNSNTSARYSGRNPAQSASERRDSFVHSVPQNSMVLEGPSSLHRATSSMEISLGVNPKQCYRFRGKIEITRLTAVLLVFNCPVVNPEYLADTIEQFIRIPIEQSTVMGGVVSSVRPDMVSIYFTGGNQARNAVRYAQRVLSLFSLPLQKIVRIIIDAGQLHLAQCSPFAKTFFGERHQFMLSLFYYSGVGEGRILLTDRVAASLDSMDECLPTDNIIPRSGEAAVLLFVLLNNTERTPSTEKAIRRYKRAFFAAVKGSYEEALSILSQDQHIPAIEEGLTKQLREGLRQLLRTNPRRPRFCRFQLPTFETLGVMVRDRRHIKLHNQLDPMQLSMTVPAIQFFPSVGGTMQGTLNGTCLSGTGGFNTLDVYEEDALCSVKDSAGLEWFIVSDAIGAGSFAEVFKVISSHGSISAIKCIRLNQANVEARDVVQEVNTSCRLFSEFIVNYNGWVQQGSRLILFMEYMPGGTLKELLQSFPVGVLPTIARRYASHMLNGLNFLNKNGIVHADLKPQNVLLSADGLCKLSDFGSCINKATNVPEDNDIFSLRGTPLYMAPEVACGETPTVASDMWSFGITLFEMLAGKLPWVWSETGEPVFPDESQLNGDGAEVEKVSVKRFIQSLIRKTVVVQLQPLPEEKCTTPTLVAHNHLLKSLSEKCPAAVELLSMCLVPEPADRITPEVALVQNFITCLELTEA
ncbi:hypothetical protein AGDE_14142 [Angomonas deanei]|uniref:Protein tyrosine kinase/Protein kinase domain containing protein, putative n=1 Tax=Angomonas deanei TaxID=59799 RepID=A0A7G2C4B8_9TRYP|nr:hypothetical protein AGDE_14142 [Angomonas deanei]CAD2212742.1 Protein tyrosine kinase/Protein kinase domain containing protein, putative [Angomonas deanei]|eukprot:EPY21350.1 hypothetical protein AGDE_14142 [Angomonas deanei]